MFENVFTSTQLKTNLREVKEAAMRDIVYITENGVIAYVLCSVEIWNREMARAEQRGRWQGMIEVRLAEAARESEDAAQQTDSPAPWRTTRDFLRDVYLAYEGPDESASERQGTFRPDLSGHAEAPHATVPDFALPAYQGVSSVLEYVSAHPEAGLDLPSYVRRERPFGDHACKFYCEGHDIIYEYDSTTGRILFCGFIPTLDDFELPEYLL